MGVVIRGSCFGCLLLALILQGGVCQNNDCQARPVAIGSSLSIHCNVSCRDVEWGLQGSDQPVSHGRNLQFQDIWNASIGGRVYWCRCRGDNQNQECFTVLVEPHIFRFVAEPSEVAVGSKFDLVCKAEGYPVPQPPQNFTLSSQHLPSFHPIPVSLRSGVKVTISNVTMSYSGNYTCVVNTLFRLDSAEIHLHTTSSTARVTVYEPPKLRGIRNFTMSNAVSNQSAILECVIERTPSAEVVMEWRRNDILLSTSWKYVNYTVYSESGSNLLVAILVVRDVSDGDLGVYECRLYSNYSYLRRRSEDVMEAWIIAPDAPNTPTTEGVGECDCDNSCTGAVVAAVIDAVVVFILISVIAIIVGVTLWRKYGVRSTPTQDENGVAPTQHTNLYVAPVLPQVTQDGQEMDNVGHLANPHVAVPPTCETNLRDRNHALHVPSDEDRAPPPAGPHPEHEVETSPNQSANSYVIAPVQVAQGEQGMNNVVQHENSNVNTPINPLVETAHSANVPGEGNVHPEQDEQERTTANNQLGDRVGDGSSQPHAPESDSPTLDKEEHFVPILTTGVKSHKGLPLSSISTSLPRGGLPFDVEQMKPRRGSHSSHNDPDVRRESKPTPLVRVVTDSSQSPRSPTKKRKFSIPSFPSKRPSQAENGEETKLLELPKTPKTSSRRQSKSENDEERKLLKEQSPVDEEHPTIGDRHDS